MRTIILSALLNALFSLPVQALEDQCFPSAAQHPEVKNWKICKIYLHGLHPSNDSGSYTRYEAENRPFIEEKYENDLLKNHCRIALPVAPNGRYKNVTKYNRHGRAYTTTQFVRTKYRDWQHRSMKTVEAAARRACGGAELQEKDKTVIGFSAGGWDLWKQKGDCEALAGYSDAVAIGLPELGRSVSDGQVATGCKGTRFTLLKTHDFASQFAKVENMLIPRTSYASRIPPVQGLTANEGGG